jgi:16S rRNA (cytosine967-C5)-methyltransferase
MTPAARIAASIELLEKLDGSLRPADEIASQYFRSRRFIGAKDRRDISERIFAIERAQSRLDWWVGGGAPRTRVIAHLALVEGAAPAELFSGGKFAPEPLSAEEQVLADRLMGQALDRADMPAAVRLELPEWLEPLFAETFGDRLEAEMAALNRPAPLDLRVNTLKATREDAQKRLAAEGIDSIPTPISPFGLRVSMRVNLTASRSYQDGWVEVQDEASQICALKVETKADRLTIDLCAGAGGKTLALAAIMKDGGPLVACDNDQGRLQRMEARLKRAGISNVTRKKIAGPEDPALDRYRRKAERVLVDAPCSGTGAWRRNPAARWQFTPERLEALREEQRKLLICASTLVAPRGRLIYATCSVLKCEDQDQADHFLEFHPDFRAVPASPENAYLSLTPARDGTDGFFVAVFEKAA